MITAHEELFSEIVDEIAVLFPGHHKELALNQDTIELNPDYEVYFQKEREGSLVLYTVRDAGVIVGYYFGFITVSLHNAPSTFCHTDIFYVSPGCRGKGAGKILFDFCETKLRARGVERWTSVSKLHSDSGAFLEKAGFSAIETVFLKTLV